MSGFGKKIARNNNRNRGWRSGRLAFPGRVLYMNMFYSEEHMQENETVQEASKPAGGVDLLLIYPPWASLGSRGILQNSLPPLGILSIAAYTEQQGFRDQILDVKLENLTSLAPLIKAVLADNYLCVVGGKQAIEESQKEFKATVSI